MRSACRLSFCSIVSHWLQFTGSATCFESICSRDRLLNSRLCLHEATLMPESYSQGLGKRAFFDDPSDFVALRPAKGEDRLSQFLRDHCNWMFEVSARAKTIAPIQKRLTPSQKKRDPSRQPWDGVRYGPESRIAKAVGFISVVVAAILLIGAIMSLYFITNPGWRLGLVAFWTSLFSLAVSILSTARRAEIFGAGAAYAAVSPVPIQSSSIITHTVA